MLRTYRPLKDHPVFVYHNYIQNLVCEVWCNAQDGTFCIDLLCNEIMELYSKRNWVKAAIDEIYELCKALTGSQRADIREAFVLNNEIEDLCEGRKRPVALDQLPNVVEKKMKPFLIKCYDDLIRAKEKLDYYNQLIESQETKCKSCPCCGLDSMESSESRYREDNDHYAPKFDYPFASVNFFNLVPLCSKCNKKYKSTKNPFENRRKSFFAFKALDCEFSITISINSTALTNYGELHQDEVSLAFNNDADKVDTWNWLYNIKDRYNEEVRQFSKTELRTLANKLWRNQNRGQNETYEQILADQIEDYCIDRFDDRKFLKAAFLREMLQKPEWMAVYHQYL